MSIHARQNEATIERSRAGDAGGPDVLEVAVDLAVEDYDAYVRRFLARHGTARRLRQLAVVVAALVVAAALVPAALSGQAITAGHLMFVAPAAVIAWLGWRSAEVMRRATVRQFEAGDARAHTGRIRMIFDPRGVTTHGPMSSTFTVWEMVSDVEETGAHLFLHLGSHRAFFLPRRTCEAPVPWDELVAKIRALRAEAANYVRRCPECDFDLAGTPVQGCPECGWERGPGAGGSRAA